MKKPAPLKVLTLTFLALFAAAGVHAENVRGSIAGTVVGEGNAVAFNPEKLLVIEPGEASGFGEALELRLLIPEGLRRYQNSFALMIFRAVQPEPDPDIQSYRGNRIFMRLLPARESIFVRIPFRDDHKTTGDALTDVLPVAVEEDGYPLLVTVLPVMKGIPDRAFGEVLTLSAVTILRNEGALTVNLINRPDDPDEKLIVTVGGEEIIPGEPVFLEAGIHRVRIDSSLAPPVERNIALEPGEELILDIELDYRAPEIVVNVPEGVLLFIDGEPVEGPEYPLVLELDPGDHTVTYRLGQLEVSRDFNLSPGARVNIDLLVDISIVDLSEGGGSPFGAGDG